MTASWNDIENAIKNNTIESLDKETLEEYLKVVPPVFNNSGLIDQARYYRERLLAARDRRGKIIVSTSSEKRWYEKPFGIVLLLVIAGLIVAWCVYNFGWN